MIRKLFNFLLSTGFAQGSYFIVSTLIIRIFGDEFYADIEVYNIISQIIFFLFGMNISASLAKFRTEIRNEYRFTSFAGNILMFGIASLILVIFSMVFLEQIFIKYFSPIENLYFLLPISFLFLYVNQWILNFNISIEHDVTHRNYQLGIGVAKVLAITTVVFLINKPTPFHKILAELIMLTVIISVYIYFHPIKLKYSSILDDCKRGLVFSTPLIAYLFFNNLLNYSDQLFISKLFNQKELAIYSAGYRLASIFLLFNGSVSNYFSIEFYNQFNDRLLHFRKTKILIYLNGALTITIVLFGRILIKLYTNWDSNQVNQAYEILKLTVIGYYVFSFYLIYSRHLYYLSKTIKISLLIVVAAIINIVLNSIGLKVHGIIYASYTTLISFSLITITSMILYIKDDKAFALKIIKHFSLVLLIILLITTIHAW